MSDSFDGARLKVKRANKHIIHLNIVAHAFLEAHRNKVAAQKKLKPMTHIELGGILIPEEIPFIAGSGYS